MRYAGRVKKLWVLQVEDTFDFNLFINFFEIMC